jgi:hypothetical protein
MGWTEERAHHCLIALVFGAIIGLIVCAGYMTQPNWGFAEGAGHGAGLSVPGLGEERR